MHLEIKIIFYFISVLYDVNKKLDFFISYFESNKMCIKSLILLFIFYNVGTVSLSFSLSVCSYNNTLELYFFYI